MTRASRAVPYLTVVATAIYLTWFVDRGWVAHDEGHLGQAAERALRGQLPHVDFDEAYTGGLTWFYAAIFGTFGVQLLWLRWALFAAALVSVVCFYRLCRRFVGPLAASVGCVLATVWAFPTYFAALPSWWNLVFAAASVLALFRAIETGGLRYVLLAGILTGVSLAVKQSALYVVAAGVLSLLYLEQTRCARRLPERAGFPAGFWLRFAAAVGAFAFVLIVLRARLTGSTFLLLALPAAVVCWLLATDAARRELPRAGGTLLPPGVFLIGVCLPMCLVAAPYLLRGATGEFLHGWLVAPQARSAHAALDPQSPAQLLLGLPVVAFVALCGLAPRAIRRWLLPAGIVTALLSPLAYGNDLAYQVIWQSARLAGFLPVLAAALLWIEVDDSPVRRGQQFVLASVMAFWSLVQYPFSAPLYFCYVVPLAPILALGLASTRDGPRWTTCLAAPAVLYLAFAVFSLNRGDLGKVGVRHDPVGDLEPLGLSRARLRIPAAEAAMYRRVIELVQEHRRTRYIYAAPDCPEVYFLSGGENPTRSFYDVLGSTSLEEIGRVLVPDRVSVVVVNRAPHFSDPPDEAFFAFVRRRYERSERVGRFEVFWTDATR